MIYLFDDRKRDPHVSLFEESSTAFSPSQANDGRRLLELSHNGYTRSYHADRLFKLYGLLQSESLSPQVVTEVAIIIMEEGGGGAHSRRRHTAVA